MFLIDNPFTWLKNHSLVFIDNPVGTGYSFTNHKNGLAKDMATVSTLYLLILVCRLLSVITRVFKTFQGSKAPNCWTFGS